MVSVCVCLRSNNHQLFEWGHKREPRTQWGVEIRRTRHETGKRDHVSSSSSSSSCVCVWQRDMKRAPHVSLSPSIAKSPPTFQIGKWADGFACQTLRLNLRHCRWRRRRRRRRNISRAQLKWKQESWGLTRWSSTDCRPREKKEKKRKTCCEFSSLFFFFFLQHTKSESFIIIIIIINFLLLINGVLSLKNGYPKADTRRSSNQTSTCTHTH